VLSRDLDDDLVDGGFDRVGELVPLLRDGTRAGVVSRRSNS
jgi:hypothetical protein